MGRNVCLWRYKMEFVLLRTLIDFVYSFDALRRTAGKLILDIENLLEQERLSVAL